MKDSGHPNYQVTKVTCGCGNSFVTRSTLPELKVDICSVCHPFFSGRIKHVDREGRIERFQNKFAKGNYASLQTKTKKTTKKKVDAES
jgi:large subunit ribosomal protein L31